MTTKTSICQLFLLVFLGFCLLGSAPLLASTPLFKSYEERAYLAQRGSITMCVDPDWMPYEKIDAHGNHIGIAADYMALFSDMIGKKVELVPTISWTQSEEFARDHKCDILSLLNKSPKRDEFLNFTDPYIEASAVLVAQKNVTYIDGMKAMAGKSLAIVKDYIYEEFIRRDFPDVELVYVETMDEAFRKVSDGKVFATIGPLYIVTTRISELGLSNLKVAGATQYSNSFRVGVRKDDLLLLGLFQRAVENLNPVDENRILKRWMSVRIEQSEDNHLLIEFLLTGAVVLLLLLYHHFRIKNLKQELGEKKAKLTLKNDELQLLSRTDKLTQLHDRMYLDESLEQEAMRFERYKSPFSCVMIDVDGFTKINDEHGHGGGDAILKALAKLLQDHVRINDTIGRWDGDRFLILCPETERNGAEKLAEHLKDTINAHRFEYVRSLTCSFGIAQFMTNDSTAKLISRADNALFKAKEMGHNRIICG